MYLITIRSANGLTLYTTSIEGNQETERRLLEWAHAINVVPQVTRVEIQHAVAMSTSRPTIWKSANGTTVELLDMQ